MGIVEDLKSIYFSAQKRKQKEKYIMKRIVSGLIAANFPSKIVVDDEGIEYVYVAFVFNKEPWSMRPELWFGPNKDTNLSDDVLYYGRVLGTEKFAAVFDIINSVASVFGTKVIVRESEGGYVYILTGNEDFYIEAQAGKMPDNRSYKVSVNDFYKLLRKVRRDRELILGRISPAKRIAHLLFASGLLPTVPKFGNWSVWIDSASIKEKRVSTVFRSTIEIGAKNTYDKVVGKIQDLTTSGYMTPVAHAVCEVLDNWLKSMKIEKTTNPAQVVISGNEKYVAQQIFDGLWARMYVGNAEE